MDSESNTPFRVLSYNVHQWVDAPGKNSNISEVISTIKKINPDEVLYPYKVKYGKQEMTALEVVAKEVGMPYFQFGKEIIHKGHDYGNAILSKHPFVTPPTNQIIGGIAGLIIADFNIGSKKPIRIATTHFDPATEELRVKQAIKMEEPHFVVGDFNALCKQDYSAQEWNNLISFNRAQKWSDPKSDAVDKILSLGYKEPFAELGRKGAKLTCWTDQPTYRVDYFFVSKDFPYKMTNYWRDESKASDHFPIVLELQL